MQICKLCEYQNPDETTICLNCAAILGEICPSCGRPVHPDSRFCGQCGASLSDHPPALRSATQFHQPTTLTQERMLLALREKIPTSLKAKILTSPTPNLAGQRRSITVVLIGIQQRPIHSKVIDSEEGYLIVEELLHRLVEIIYKYEGTIDRLSTENLMAIFGIPLNHENDPERAVRSALEMQSYLHSFKASRKTEAVDIDIQIGINTGQVITGNLGSDYHMDYTVVGDTINLVYQLQAQAPPGATLVSFQTYQLTLPLIEFEKFTPIQHDAASASSPSYRPIRVRAKPGQVRGLPGLQLPMVGRRKDLQQLTDAINQVQLDREFRIVFVSGDAGMGKSRLVAEFIRTVADRPLNIYQGTCSSYMRITPYRVIRTIISDMLHLSEMDTEEMQRKALKEFIHRNKLDSGELLPYLLYVLDLSQDDMVMESRLRLLSPTMLQRQVFFALRLFLTAEAITTPTLIIFDDLHWVDPVSSDFLNYFIQAIEGAPILLILLARSFTDQPSLRALVDISHKVKHAPFSLELKPLSVKETRLLANQMIPEDSTIARRIKDQIVTKSAGNPYYTEELVRILMDYGGMIDQDYSWRLTDKAQEIIQKVPGTLRDIILARFDRLQEELQLLAQKTAVIGQSFTVNFLKALLNSDPHSLIDHLRELEQRNFLIFSEIEGEIGCSFKHPLIRDAIYDTLLKNDLRKFHLHIAQVAERGSNFFLGERNEILAYHYAASSAPEMAIPYLRNAAESALHRNANQNAVEHFRRLIELMEKYPPEPATLLSQAQVGFGKALKFTGEISEGKTALENGINGLLADQQYLQDPAQLQMLIDGFSELADLLTREGNFDGAMELLQRGIALLGESPHEQHPEHWRRLADRIAWVYFRHGKLEEAFRQADLALLDVRLWEQDDPITLASLYNTLGGIYWIRAKLPEALQSVERSLEIYKNLSYAWGMAIAYTNMGVLYFSLGQWAKAVENLERADSLRREYGYLLERPTGLKNLGEVLICMGDFTRARETLLVGREISQRLGMNPAVIYAEIGLCRLAIYEEDFDQARAHLLAAKSLLDPSNEVEDDQIAQILTLEAILLAESGDFARGENCAAKAYQIAMKGGLSTEEVDALRTLGVVHVKMKNYRQAEEHLLESARLAEKQGDRYHQALALFELGELYTARCLEEPMRIEGLIRKARQAYGKASNELESLGAHHDLSRVQNAIRELAWVEKQFAYPLPDPTSLADKLFRTTPLSNGVASGEWYRAVVVYLMFVPDPNQDEEAIFESYTLLIPSFAEFVRENEGHIIRGQDSLTILFGVLTTHEDDAERAMETAIQITNHYHELNSQIHLPVSVKLAVSMGKVVAGKVDLIGQEGLVATGEAIDQAQALVDVVPSTQVWVTQPVQNATAHRYEFRPISFDLAANDTKQEIFQLLGLREQIRPVRGLIGIKTPFIGRAAEIEAMLTIGENLKRHEGGFIWIEGEAGIGKSRLIREFSQLLVERVPLRVLYGACTARRAERAFSIFSDLLFQFFELKPGATSEQISLRIEQKLENWPDEMLQARPFLKFLLGLQPEDGLSENILAWEPEQLRRQTFIHLRKFFNYLTAERPLLLLLDDLQWIDSISADLLMFLAYLTESQPLLIVGTQRSTETSASENVLVKVKQTHLDRTVQLLIQPFTKTESFELLTKILSSTSLATETLDFIIQQSGGNPYYIEEFIRMLLEQKYLRLHHGQLEINQRLEINQLEIPTSLEALIRARIDSLPNQAKKVIQSAAVIGQAFNQPLLATVSQLTIVEGMMELLRNRGILVQESETEYWRFSHVLIETTVYNTVLRAQRQILHGRAARALEELWRGNEAEHAEDLAYHYQKANEVEKAITYLILAGERAAARYANEEALALFEEANELLAGIAHPKEDDRWRIAVGLGSIYLLIGNNEASIAALKTALELISSSKLSNAQRAGLYRLLGEAEQKKGDQDRATNYFTQALAVLGVPSDRQDEVEAARIYTRQGWSHFFNGDLVSAESACLQALHYSKNAENPIALAMAENLMGGIFYRLGEFNQASQHTLQALNNWQELGYTWGVATSLGNLGILQISAGNWEAAQEYFHRSLKLYQETGDVEAIARAYNNLGTLARDRGQLDVAEAHFRDSLDIANLYQMAWQKANSTHGLAQSLLYKGELEKAQEALLQSIVLAENIGAQNMLAEIRLTEAELRLALGELGRAADIAALAVELANESGNRLVEASAWRVLSEIFRLQEGPISAQQALAKAWKALAESTDELENGRCHAQAARLEMELGNQEKAQKHYQKAYEIFSHLGAMRDLERLPQV